MLKLFPSCSLLWVPDIYPKCFTLHGTHHKCNCQTSFLYFQKQNNWKTITGQKFSRGQKFHLTPDFRTRVRQDSAQFEKTDRIRTTVSFKFLNQDQDFEISLFWDLTPTQS